MPPTCLFNFAAAEISRPPIAMQPSDHSKPPPRHPDGYILGSLTPDYRADDGEFYRNRRPRKFPRSALEGKNLCFDGHLPKAKTHVSTKLPTWARDDNETEVRVSTSLEKTSPIQVWLSLSRRSIRERWRAGLPWESWLCPWKNVSVGLCAEPHECRRSEGAVWRGTVYISPDERKSPAAAGARGTPSAVSTVIHCLVWTLISPAGPGRWIGWFMDGLH